MTIFPVLPSIFQDHMRMIVSLVSRLALVSHLGPNFENRSGTTFRHILKGIFVFVPDVPLYFTKRYIMAHRDCSPPIQKKKTFAKNTETTGTDRHFPHQVYDFMKSNLSQVLCRIWDVRPTIMFRKDRKLKSIKRNGKCHNSQT